MHKSALFILIFLSTAGVVFADQTLTVTLDPAQKSSPQSDLHLKHETLQAARDESSKQYITAQPKPAKESHPKEIVIGRVGIIASAKADIKSYPGRRGRVLYTCPKETCIAILGQNSSWYGVLMADASTGWIEKSKVDLLNYQLLSPTSPSYGIGSRVVNAALKYLGIPYRWGGYSLGGLDCSGFVKAVFACHGVALPRVARDQARVGTPIGWTQLQPGDRLYFACKGGEIDHAGIYMGNGLFIHSSISRGGVAVDKLAKPFFANSLVAARRS